MEGHVILKNSVGEGRKVELTNTIQTILLKKQKVIILDLYREFRRMTFSLNGNVTLLTGHFIYKKTNCLLSNFSFQRTYNKNHIFFLFHLLEMIFLTENSLFLFVTDTSSIYKDRETIRLFHDYLTKIKEKNIIVYFPCENLSKLKE